MLGFRDVWAFVGQKGIEGFSPLEEVERTIKTYNNTIEELATVLQHHYRHMKHADSMGCTDTVIDVISEIGERYCMFS